MFSLKNLWIFLAGAAFFHTLSHILLPYYVQLPWQVNGMTITESFNNWVIGGSAVLTVVLLWLGSRTK